MNIRQIILASASVASAALLSSCTVDGYGYSGTYGTGYDTYDYGPSYYAGTTVYSSNYYNRPGYHGSYCPPSRPVVIHHHDHDHDRPGRPGWSGGGHGSRPGGSWSGGHGSHGGSRPVVVDPPRGGGGFAGYRDEVRESRPVVVESPRPAPVSRPEPSVPREDRGGRSGMTAWGRKGGQAD
jgi:hypothetical protein